MFWYTADLIKCHILAIRGISVYSNQLGAVHTNSQKNWDTVLIKLKKLSSNRTFSYFHDPTSHLKKLVKDMIFLFYEEKDTGRNN